MGEKLSERKYQGVCRKCPCFEDSSYTDTGMWCYWFKDDDKPDCSSRLVSEALESRCAALEKQVDSFAKNYAQIYDELVLLKKGAKSVEAEG